MHEATRYWRSPEEPQAATGQGDEFPEPLDREPVPFTRRGFLRAVGAAAASTALTGCGRAPVEKAIPLLVPPEEIVPGRSYFYASTCGGCSAACGVLVKVRDGRPIKLEGNPAHPLSRAGLCAVGQAAVNALYDSRRLRVPLLDGKESTWEELDRALLARLAAVRQQGGAVRLLTGTITSPTLRAAMGRFLGQFRGARLVTYDALSCSAILAAHEQTHGRRILPRYRFDRAEVIVSFDADFLGTWIAPVEFTAAWRAGRQPDAEPPRMSYHMQFESRLSLTGTKADRRVRVAPQELGACLTHLAARLARTAGVAFPAGELSEPPVEAKQLEALAQRLGQARGRSLVVCGSQDVPTQVLVNFVNHLLGNYGATLDVERPSQQRQGNDAELLNLLEELHAGQVAALFLLGANPVAELPGGQRLAEAIRRVPLVVALSQRRDETTRLAHCVAPDHHFLESWGDAEPVRGLVSLFQPAIRPLGNTRAAIESLAAWSGQQQASYDLLQAYWRANVFPKQKRATDFQAFWDGAVHDGYVEREVEPVRATSFRLAAVKPVPPATPGGGALALVLYPKVAVLDGRHAHNAWLQELPDPVSKVTWDNYACLSPATAARLGLMQDDVVQIECAGQSLELPVYVQPGQHDGVVAVALGYGRVETEQFAHVGPRWWQARPSVGANGRVGQNADSLAIFAHGALGYVRYDARLTRTGRKHALACTQSHHTIAMPQNLPVVGGQPRPTVHEMTLAGLAAGASLEKHLDDQREDLYPPDHTYPVHRWAMVIDTSACTGCSSCVVACLAENNIPVVGRDEVLRRREMHWLRIDRYYAGSTDEPDVIHQPMLCQQCDYAPCETVCPVLATVHSAEGLNQQIYNRCVGTRYCANNCPYKTRRFNWFDYPRDDRLANLALNPDVTVRSRGVMEKCTFCVQRIQEAKIEAKRRGEAMAEGAVQTACQQSCPAQAILFGDLHDPASRVAQLARSRRGYRVLAEMNFRPAVTYLAAVRNREETNPPPAVQAQEPKRHG